MLQTLYDRSPLFVQQAMTTAKGLSIARHRYRGIYREHREWLQHFDGLTLEEKHSYQLLRLKEFVRTAYNESEFYRSAFDTVGVHPDDLKSLSDLKNFAELSKDQIRLNSRSMLPKRNLGPLHTAHTGGTTGSSLVIAMAERDVQRRNAMLDHFKSRSGFEHLKMRRASFTGKHMVPPRQDGPPYSRLNLAGKQLLFSSFNLNESTAPDYLAEMNNFAPHSIDGFPSGMTTLARHMLSRGVELRNPPIAIFPTAETLTADDKDLLETAFNAPVYNQYASSEGAPFITECPRSRLHVEMSTGVFEYESDGQIIVTAFDTSATPLIRYRIGDRATPSHEIDCECGIQSEIVADIRGRTSEFLYRADGTKVFSANLSNVVKNIPNAIIESQFRQVRIGLVEMLIVVDPLTYDSKFDKVLSDEFRHKFDDDTMLELIRVDQIPRERSGKRLFLKNQVKSMPS